MRNVGDMKSCERKEIRHDRTEDLPLLLIFVGVIGGLIGFGIIGLFVGPVILAVTYRLIESWIADSDRTLEESSLESVSVAAVP